MWVRLSLAYKLSGFSTRQLGVFLLPPPALSLPVPIYTPGWRERHCESRVSCPRTQHNVPGARPRTARSVDERANHEATTPLTTWSNRIRECRIRYLNTVTVIIIILHVSNPLDLVELCNLCYSGLCFLIVASNIIVYSVMFVSGIV